MDPIPLAIPIRGPAHLVAKDMGKKAVERTFFRPRPNNATLTHSHMARTPWTARRTATVRARGRCPKAGESAVKCAVVTVVCSAILPEHPINLPCCGFSSAPEYAVYSSPSEEHERGYTILFFLASLARDGTGCRSDRDRHGLRL